MLIKNIHLINPKTNYDDITDILIVDGVISKIEKNISSKIISSSEEIIDGSGLYACPGLVDEHSHFRDPGFTYKEDIISGAKAAAAGGFTTIVLMANTNPVVDNVETLEYVINKGKETGINIHTVATVTQGLKGQTLTDMNTLKERGAAGFSDDGIPIMNEALLKEAFIKAKELNVPVSLHEENPSLITNNGINAGDIANAIGVVGSPREAEISMIQRDVEIALDTGVDLNIQHISTKEGVELIRKARKKGQNIHAEATPHHFTLTDNALLEFGTCAKMNPPLRTEEDRLAIIEGIKDGTIEIIATDHAPHSKEEKDKALINAPSGIIGLETSLSLGISELVNKGYISLMTLIERMTLGPAKLYHMEDTISSVEPGRAADICIFDINEKYIPTKFKSKSSNSPFYEREMSGRVKYTICNGKVVYRQNEN